MGNKHDALAVLLARHAPHQQPVWAPSDRTALAMLSRAPVPLIRLPGGAGDQPDRPHPGPLPGAGRQPVPAAARHRPGGDHPPPAAAGPAGTGAPPGAPPVMRQGARRGQGGRAAGVPIEDRSGASNPEPDNPRPRCQTTSGPTTSSRRRAGVPKGSGCWIDQSTVSWPGDTQHGMGWSQRQGQILTRRSHLPSNADPIFIFHQCSQQTVQHCGHGICMAVVSTMPNQTLYQRLAASMDKKGIQEHVELWQ
ncbi:hypothetical protein BDW68DRAFT_183032 [Aspergillus falconensis]